MKIMIVDDDNTTIFFLERILFRRGFESVRAENGRIALDRIRSEPPDIIISDVMMPELDGFEFFSTLRQSETTAHIPFIFLSKKDDPKDQLKGLRMGADEYLLKPFSPSDILGTIDRVLEKSSKIKDLKEDVDIAGNLNQVGLGEVVQLIEMNQSSGELVITSASGKEQGRVYLNEGRIVDAVSGDIQGAEAFYVLATNLEGGFRFYIHDVKREDGINQQNMKLVMEATRLNDEAKALHSHVSGMDASLVLLTPNIPKALFESVKAEALNSIFSAVRDGRTVKEVIESSGLSNLRAAAVLSDMINAGVIAEKSSVGKQPETDNGSHQESVLVKGNLVNRLKDIEGTSFTGKFVIQGRSKPAEIHIEQGQVINAKHGETRGKKALFRIFSERGGTCNIREHPVEAGRTINSPLADLIAEASDEIAWRRRLKVAFTDIQVVISDKGIEELESLKADPAKSSLLEIVRNHSLMSDIIDASPFTDLETSQLLEELRANRILVFSKLATN